MVLFKIEKHTGIEFFGFSLEITGRYEVLTVLSPPL